MKRRLTDYLRERRFLQHYVECRVGSDEVHVMLPFVHLDQTQQPVRATKPLNLARTSRPISGYMATPGFVASGA
jgi:hypothetical protein